MKVVQAPTAYAAIRMPSRSWWGLRSRRMRSLNEPGSDSSALHTRYFGTSLSAGMNAHLSPVLKPAPPRPCRPDAFTSSITSPGAISVSALRAAAYPPFFS